MKTKAVCIRCGTFKKDAFAICPDCGLSPKTDYEAARALILSEKTLIGDVEIGRSAEELQKIAELIRKGRPYAIDGEEQKMVVREYYAYLKSLPAPKWYQEKKVKLVGFIIVALMIVAAVVWWVITKYI